MNNNPSGESGRQLRATPHEIAVQVAHERLQLGQAIEDLDHGRIAQMMKNAIFAAVRDAIIENSDSASGQSKV